MIGATILSAISAATLWAFSHTTLSWIVVPCFMFYFIALFITLLKYQDLSERIAKLEEKKKEDSNGNKED